MDKENNVVTMFGRLGKEPVIRYTAKKEAVCSFSIAVNLADDITKWFEVVVWGEFAERCKLYLKKGYPVFVQGPSQNKEYTNKKGELVKYNEVNAWNIGFSRI